MPLPSSKIVPCDENGLPLDTYWLLQFLMRKIYPNWPIPLYDKQGVPIDNNEEFDYMKINQKFDKAFLNIKPFDREKFLHAYRNGEYYYHPDFIVQHFVGSILKPRFSEFTLWTYQDWCDKYDPHFVPLFTPTIPDLAIAYITTKKNPDAKLDDRRFPNGFTEEHRQWLIACATPSAIEYLQTHAGPSDPVLIAILEKRKKPLPNSPYYLI
ncbi:MAG: hypothetical protein K9W44_03685 [Candidatus Lokiarchaeota archaeon]|nr:hypothetical protein [Candidatus Harpocratesius repetitus]